MRWNKKSRPEVGDYKVVRKFAWLPKTVGAYTVWLERYEELYEYTLRERYVFMYRCPPLLMVCKGWDLVSSRNYSRRENKNVDLEKHNLHNL